MTPMIQLFYGPQVTKINNNITIMKAINNTLDWLMQTGYTNFFD